MWFLNKETGLSWDVSDIALIKRLEQSEHFEQVEESNEEKEIASTVLENKNKKSAGKEAEA
jgi:hypothetical protein